MMDFDTFLDATRTTVFPGTKPSFISVAAFFVICFLVSNYHSYKEKTIKLLPYHSFYGDHIPPRKLEAPFLAVRLKNIQSRQDSHLAAFP